MTPPLHVLSAAATSLHSLSLLTGPTINDSLMFAHSPTIPTTTILNPTTTILSAANAASSAHLGYPVTYKLLPNLAGPGEGRV